MGVVVRVVESALAGLLEALAFYLPTVRIKGSFGRHIYHTAAAGGIAVIVPLNVAAERDHSVAL